MTDQTAEEVLTEVLTEIIGGPRVGPIAAAQVAALTAAGLLGGEIESWPLSLADTHRIVEHLIHDATRDGLALGDLLNAAMGASARRRAALAPAPLDAREGEEA